VTPDNSEGENDDIESYGAKISLHKPLSANSNGEPEFTARLNIVCISSDLYSIGSVSGVAFSGSVFEPGRPPALDAQHELRLTGFALGTTHLRHH
jgi:hypothetical protein